MPTSVGLDLSLTSTGICANGDAQTISTNLKGIPRLNCISSMITNRLSEVLSPMVCIEGYSFGSRNSQAHSIGELGGVVRLTLWKRNIPWVDIPPTCRAKFATGKGNAAKNEVVSAISARTGIVWSGKGADDMCDAWILEEMGLVHFGLSRYNWPKENLSALEKIDWSSFDEYDHAPDESKLLINILRENEQEN